MKPQLSIVIVNHNTRRLLYDCLQSLGLARTKLALEVIVVDNASSDDSVEMCEKFFPEALVMRNDSNLGFGRSNNQGIQASSSDIVLLLNSDTIILPDCLEKMIQRMHENPSVGVLGCQLVHPDGTLQRSCMNFPNLKTVVVERLLLYKLSSRLPQTTGEQPFPISRIECDWVLGASMLIRKKAIESSGLFDPDYFMYGEEMELCYRIRAAGWRILFEPGIRVIHIKAGSWKEKGYSPTLLKMTGLLCFFRKHSSTATYFTVLLLAAVGAILRLLIWMVLYGYKKSKRTHVLLEIKSNYRFLRHIIRGSALPKA